MGGWGSGRHGYSAKATCEQMHSVDLAYLRRNNLMTPGRTATLSWSRHGQQTGSIQIISVIDGVWLAYRAIAKRLGSTWGCAFDGSWLPPKPKRRLEERYEALQRQGMAGAYAKFLR